MVFSPAFVHERYSLRPTRPTLNAEEEFAVRLLVNCDGASSSGQRIRHGLTANSDRAAFLGDLNFPDFGMSHKFSTQLYLITALYEHYSALSFTHYTDKSIAISGMELRLTGSSTSRAALAFFNSINQGGFRGSERKTWNR